VHLHERLEHRVELVGGNADAGVGDAHGRVIGTVSATATVMRPPSGVNLTAFESRLSTICPSFSRSAHT
jgi:hypothetical protein